MGEENRASELKDPNFSIICNNCIGGFIYKYYGIEYRTPTLWLFIVAKDYIKFLGDIKFYLSQKLEFIKPEQSKNYESFKQYAQYINFPIAQLGDIEVFFMHYKSEKEAEEKWYRRIRKINYDDLIVIMSENETFDYEVLKEFEALPYKNKVCFTKNKYPDAKYTYYIEEMQEKGRQWNAEDIVKHFDLTGFLNNRSK